VSTSNSIDAIGRIRAGRAPVFGKIFHSAEHPFTMSDDHTQVFIWIAVVFAYDVPDTLSRLPVSPPDSCLEGACGELK
jgi:hypothetical protein